MTRLTVDTYIRHTIASGVSVYPYPFKVSSASALKVRKLDLELRVESTYTLNSDYSVQGAGAESGGTITWLIQPPTATEILIELDEPLTQEASYPKSGNFNGPAHETALDAAMAAAQRAINEANRTLKLAHGDSLQLAPLASFGAGAVPQIRAKEGGGFEALPIEIGPIETLAAIADKLSALGDVAAAIARLGTVDAVSDMNTLANASIIANISALSESATLLAIAAIKSDLDLGASSKILTALDNANAAAAGAATATAKASDANNSAIAASYSEDEIAELLAILNLFDGGPYADLDAAITAGVAVDQLYIRADRTLQAVLNVDTDPDEFQVSPMTAQQIADLAEAKALADNPLIQTLAALQGITANKAIYATDVDVLATYSTTVLGRLVANASTDEELAALAGTVIDVDVLHYSANLNALDVASQPFGRSLLNLVNAGAGRTALQLGNIATTNRTVSTAAPSGTPADGDEWLRVVPA